MGITTTLQLASLNSKGHPGYAPGTVKVHQDQSWNAAGPHSVIILTTVTITLNCPQILTPYALTACTHIEFMRLVMTLLI